MGGRREKKIYLSRTRDIHTDEYTEGRVTKHRQQEFITVRVYNSHMASIPAIWTV